MIEKLTIHDLYIREIDTIPKDGMTSIPLLSFDDHLLRRFGFSESMTVEPGYRSEMKVREVADEIWVCMEGNVRFLWLDLRENSPSFNHSFEYLTTKPTLVLVPFGVAFGFQTLDKMTQLIRFSTHMEGLHTGDHVFSPEKN
jgi:hypothetical protein